MAKAKEIPYTQEQLRELLDYDPDTGVLRWRERSIEWFGRQQDCTRFNDRYAGQEAGTIMTSKRSGYRGRHIHSAGMRANVARIAWKWMTGEDTEVIDHINHDGVDNRWNNLRKSDRLSNNQNVSKSRNNRSGVTGVHWRPDMNKWRAGVESGGKKYHAGYFDYEDLDLAAMAVMEKRIELGFDPTHGIDFAPHYKPT